MLPDIQSSSDPRGIDLDQVGVSNVRYPLLLPLRSGGEFNTVANLSMAVHLTHDRKGVHMSRFMIALSEQNQHFRPDSVHLVLQELLDLLNAEEAFLDMAFPIFLRREAPVTSNAGLLDYDCFFRAMMSKDGVHDKIVGVRVNAASCCPCSKEISAYGAHNQRSEISLSVRPRTRRIRLVRGSHRHRRKAVLPASSTPFSSARTRRSLPSAPTKIRSSSRTS